MVVSLGQGYQRITAKVCGDEVAPMLSLRLAEIDGRPAADLEVSVSQQASTDAAGRMRRDKPAAKPKPRRRTRKAKVLGSVQQSFDNGGDVSASYSKAFLVAAGVAAIGMVSASMVRRT